MNYLTLLNFSLINRYLIMYWFQTFSYCKLKYGKWLKDISSFKFQCISYAHLLVPSRATIAKPIQAAPTNPADSTHSSPGFHFSTSNRPECIMCLPQRDSAFAIQSELIRRIASYIRRIVFVVSHWNWKSMTSELFSNAFHAIMMIDVNFKFKPTDMGTGKASFLSRELLSFKRSLSSSTGAQLFKSKEPSTAPASANRGSFVAGL